MVAVGIFWSSKYYRGVAGVEVAGFYGTQNSRVGRNSASGISNKLAAARSVELDLESEDDVEVVVWAKGGPVWPFSGKTSISGLFLVVAVVTDVGS